LLFCSGVNYAMNIPLKDGMTDEAYGALFRPVLSKVMEVYQPEVIVFQSGEPPPPLPPQNPHPPSPRFPTLLRTIPFAV